MKKILLTTGLVIASTFAAGAETQSNVQGQDLPRVHDTMKRGMAQVMMATSTVPAMVGMITTGDAATDAQLKALTVEMETKIKAIRDQYEAQIKALIGTKKIMVATSSRSMMGVTRPMMRDDRADGSHGEENRSSQAEATTETTASGADDRRGAPLLQGGDISGRVQNFFRGIFGR